jgi:glycosyltransferase involved in cell wall biosynthesis
MTKLAVLIPVYRNQAGLDRSLDSLRKADGGFDVVIVDDGNPQRISVPSHLRAAVRVLVVRLEENQGIAAALNHGLRHILARGYHYIGRLDAGDTVVSERFERQMEFLDAFPKCGVVSSFVDFVDSGQVTLFHYRAPCDHTNIVQRLHANNCLVHSGSMLRAAALRDIGLYREDVPGAEDYELFLRMAPRYQLAVLPKTLTRCEYSLHGLTVAGRRRQQRERLKLQLGHFDPGSPYSFYGVARTLVAMLTPHAFVFRLRSFARVPKLQ